MHFRYEHVKCGGEMATYDPAPWPSSWPTNWKIGRKGKAELDGGGLWTPCFGGLVSFSTGVILAFLNCTLHQHKFPVTNLHIEILISNSHININYYICIFCSLSRKAKWSFSITKSIFYELNEKLLKIKQRFIPCGLGFPKNFLWGFILQEQVLKWAEIY